MHFKPRPHGAALLDFIGRISAVKPVMKVEEGSENPDANVLEY